MSIMRPRVGRLYIDNTAGGPRPMDHDQIQIHDNIIAFGMTMMILLVIAFALAVRRLSTLTVPRSKPD